MDKDWPLRVASSFACLNMALNQLNDGLERAMPGYIATVAWEAPWWIMILSAAIWAWLTVYVFMKGVK